jgi:hypothetical protein
MRMEARYVNIPGSKTHELPPLLVHSLETSETPGDVLDHAAAIVESEDILGVNGVDEELLEQRKLDLALGLAGSYRDLISHWTWGDSILEWIRQCEITFEAEAVLRPFLHPDLWPHAGRSSFVTLLMEKSVGRPGVALDRAVGLRLTFRQPPPIDCFSNQFLFLLNGSVAGTAYETWARMGGAYLGLPPERFHFDVLDMSRL